MAYPIFKEGGFEITDLSFTPSVIAPGETVQFSVTLKNVSGSAITKCRVELNGRYASTSTRGSGGITTVFLYGNNDYYSADGGLASISWGKNASKTFSGSVVFTLNNQLPIDTSEYVMNLIDTYFSLNLTVNVDIGSGNYDNCDTLRGLNGEYLTVLSYRDNPKLTFETERTPDDESSALATTLKLMGDTDSSLIVAHGYTLKLYCEQGNGGATINSSEVPLNCTIETACAGFVKSTELVTQAFPNTYDYSLLLYLTNGYETARATSTIARAFANLHLSGKSNGGVCFGSFCKSTDENPMFECYYPSYFYGGIADWGGSVQSGITDEGLYVKKDGYLDVEVTFPTAFVSVPVVMLTVYSESVAAEFGSFQVAVVPTTLSATGFTMRLFNNTGAGRYPYVRWLAIAI